MLSVITFNLKLSFKMSEPLSPPKKMAKKWYNKSYKQEWLELKLNDWPQGSCSEKERSYYSCCNMKIKKKKCK